MWNFWTYLRINGNGNGRKHGKKTKTKQNKTKKKTNRQVAEPYLYVSARRGNKKTGFRYGIPRFRNLKTW